MSNSASITQCTRCGSISFYNDDQGNKNCSECHMRFEGFLAQTTETVAAVIGAQVVRVKKTLNSATEIVKIIEKDNRYHILQLLLREQVSVLIKHYKFNRQLYQIVGDLWHSYLLSIRQVMEKVDDLKEQKQDDNNQAAAAATTTNNTDEDEDVQIDIAAIREKPSPILTLSIIYLALSWLKEPVTPSDLLNMLQEGHLMSTIPQITWDTNPAKWCNFIKIQNTAYDLSKYLNFTPRTNMKLLMVRFCTELELPKFILQLSYQLIQVLEIPYVIAQNHKDKDKKWQYYLDIHHCRVELSHYTEYLDGLVEKEMDTLNSEMVDDIFNNSYLEFPVPTSDQEIQEDIKFQFEKWMYHRISIIQGSDSLPKSNLWDVKDATKLPKTINRNAPKYYLHEFVNERYKSYLKQFRKYDNQNSDDEDEQHNDNNNNIYSHSDETSESMLSYNFESFFKQPTNDFLSYNNDNELDYRPCNKYSSYKGSKKTDYFADMKECLKRIKINKHIVVKVFDESIKRNDVQLLNYLYLFVKEKSSALLEVVMVNRIVLVAITSNSLECLVYLDQYRDRYNWDYLSVLAIVPEFGDLNMLIWMWKLAEADPLDNKYIQKAVQYGRLDMVQWILSNTKTRGDQLLNIAVSLGHMHIIRWLQENIENSSWQNEQLKTESVEIMLRVSGKNCNELLELIQWIHLNHSHAFSQEVMNESAAKGHLALVEWLHVNRGEGFTAAAMDKAATDGHLEVVQWLHANRTEGCSIAAMNRAASNGHVNVVRWLHANRTEGCSTLAMLYAAQNGSLETVQFLQENRTERTTLAMRSALERGHLEVAKYLQQHNHVSYQRCDIALLLAVINFQPFEITQWLVTNRHHDLFDLLDQAIEYAKHLNKTEIFNWLSEYQKQHQQLQQPDTENNQQQQQQQQ
ncbi:hypothetical protein PPL_07793 [Heterostelium album PN500]|uniref:Rrn7/TAF1B N-terminal cyclin domain-containing protein n=1 Tax=Heterostelium pallidum (strain ATCC 26659 / Pp 5 / PN500) TaxID=670386 RepID=D3BGZ1_HETP5|nr:hypothetical protein PPL_07793 [Heterostelium album PN500]EFA79375.1 hypothetical protein PPL_07793 [Heterostelium album PN500]|eukprot:XP_020431496.1 hypothetical protein PPL_07793 [Heterostelium album PN500]